VIHSGCR